MPRWSPDGSRIAWSSGDGAYVMDLQTGDTQPVSDVDGWVEWIDGDTWMIEAGVD
jgi:Tol biopolymer transport system component